MTQIIVEKFKLKDSGDLSTYLRVEEGNFHYKTYYSKLDQLFLTYVL